MIQQFPIVDAHTHTYPSYEKASKILKSFTDFYKMQPSNIGEGTIDEVVINMQKHGIDFTILANFAPAKILHQNNIWTLNESKKCKTLIPMVSLHPEMGYGLVEHLKEYISLGAKGLKFHSSVQELEADNVALAEVYEYCEEISFPILFHCGLVSEETTNNYSDIEMLLPIIERYRNIPIILGHMAEGKIEDVLWLAQAHSNVFFDTSITISGLHCIKRVHDDCWQDDDVVIEVIKKIGADRILFGSDYPFGSPIHDINRLIQMDISDLDKKLILGGNAIRLFGIESNRLPTN